LLGQERS